MTAYCEINKLPYINEEMIILLNLRDIYILNNEEGKFFLGEYEYIGRILADKLRKDIYRYDIVNTMKNEYIIPTIQYTKNLEFEMAQQKYIEMIEMLKLRYGYSELKSKEKIKRLH